MAMRELLIASDNALRATLPYFKTGANNKFVDNLFSLFSERGWAPLRVSEARDQIDAKAGPNAAYTYSYIATMSEVAKRLHAGNCAEQAAVAFMELYWRGVRPLDYCEIYKGDHAFVVVGAPVQPRPGNTPQWMSEAAVCDPWNRFVGSARLFLRQLYRGESVKGLYRKATR